MENDLPSFWYRNQLVNFQDADVARLQHRIDGALETRPREGRTKKKVAEVAVYKLVLHNRPFLSDWLLDSLSYHFVTTV